MREINIVEADIRCIDDFDFLDESLNVTYELWFDVDKYFGTNTRNTDAWINFYTMYHKDGSITATYIICHPEKDEEHTWELTEEEKRFFKEKMESYCQEKCGHDLAWLYRECM